MNIAFISALRCHMFDLAALLSTDDNTRIKVFTAYPKWKLKGETFSLKQTLTYPWYMVPKLALQRWKLLSPSMEEAFNWRVLESLDHYVAKRLQGIDVLEGMSSFSLAAGKAMQKQGGKFVVHHGSAHVLYQDKLLSEEAQRWGIKYRPCDKRIQEKALEEFELADKINLPSQYGKRTFVEEGVLAEKIATIPYGVDLSHFSQKGFPLDKHFQVVFAGQISLRKGIPYLLEAFSKFKHPRKRLLLVGDVWQDMKCLLSRFLLDDVEFVGRVDRARIQEIYSESHVMVLPSIDDGFGKVITEAMACGCPVIASKNTGAYGYLKDGVDGFVVPIRDSEAIADRLQYLADSEEKRIAMSQAAKQRVQNINGWQDYCQQFYSLCQSLLVR